MVNRQVRRGQLEYLEVSNEVYLLLTKGLCGVVDGFEALAESVSRETVAQFRSKSQRAFSAIKSAQS